jgi:hypothetical protein
MKKNTDKIPNSDMDGGWKDVIEDFTEDFFRFFLPDMHEGIDFAQGVKFLDKELNEIVSDSDNIRREADRLLEVRLKNGAAEWVLIHIEVQGFRDDSFAERMYVYNYRIFDKYRKRTASVAVLIDGERKFRSKSFRMKLFGCMTLFEFPVIKLLDFDREGIEKDDNPFAIVTRVQLAKLKSERDADRRYSFRMELTKELYLRNYSKEQVIRLYRFIDYVLKLPKLKALQFKKELELFEEGRKMPYITSTERIAREEGMLQGVQQGQLKEAQKAVLKVLEVRFGNIPYGTKEKITYCDDLNRLEKCLQEAVLIKSLTEFGLP